ncbi:MAG: InlB B-repeat-containing protein [Paludibacteraceae bacterium]|nr:InlB B-repeat-containing protein [Paludibacteraceae bacterium]
MKQLIQNITTSISLPRALARRLVLLLAVLLVGVSNAWGASVTRTWTATTAVSSGKGTAEAAIYTYKVFESDSRDDYKSTKYGTPVSAFKSETNTGWTTVEANAKFTTYRYCKFTAIPDDGYRFVGWYSPADASSASSTEDSYQPANASNQSMSYTYYAKFMANTYTVKFNLNYNGAPDPSSKTVTFDAAYGDLPTPTRTGYTFVGWYTASSGGTQVTSSTIVKTASNHSIYAHWTANTYTVTLDKKGGTGGSGSVVATFDSAMPTGANVTAPTKSGCIFLGYFDAESGGTKYYNANMSSARTWNKAGSSTLYAHWKAVFNFNVTAGYVDINSGTHAWGNPTVSGITAYQEIEGVTSSKQTATFTANPADANCTFIGWYSKANIDPSNDTPVSTSATYTTNVTNSTPGSTTELHLYAYYKHNQTLSWSNPSLDTSDPLVVGKSVVNTAATSSMGQQVTYTSSNDGALEVDVNGNLTPKAEVSGTVCITATAGNNLYNTASLTRCFIVKDRKTPVFTPDSGATFNQKVDDSFIITLDKVSDGLDGDFRVSASPAGIVSWTRSGNVLTISCDHPGSTTLTLSQIGNEDIYADTATYTINVTRYANTLSLTVPNSYYVGESKSVTIDGRNSNADIEVAIKGVINSTQHHPNQSYQDSVISYAGATITAWNKGIATITFTQPQNNKYEGFRKTVNVNVDKYDNTLNPTISTTSLLVEGTANITMGDKIDDVSNPINVAISNQSTPTHPNPSDGTNIITYANNVVSAMNAGSARIAISQDEDYKYYAAQSKTFDITVSKYANTIRVNGSTAYSTSLNYASTHGISITRDNTNSVPSVSASSNSTVATYAGTGTSGIITTYYTSGSASWTVTQDEDYKYLGGNATITANVSQQSESTCYLVDETNPDQGEHKINGTPYTITWSDEIEGVAGTLTFEGKRTATGNGHISIYSLNNNQWQSCYSVYGKASLSSQDLEDYYKSYSKQLDPISQGLSFRDDGYLAKYVQKIKVTRRTFLRAKPYSSAPQDQLSPSLIFGTTLEGNQITRQFYVEWSSSNTGDILLSSNNPHFTVSPTVITNTDCASGRTLVTVTYLADEHPEGTDITHNGTITIYDKGRVTSVNVTGITQPQYNLVVSGQNKAIQVEGDLNLSDIITYSYEGNSVVPAVPTYGENSSPFYFTITQNSITSNQNDCNVPGTVVTYDSDTKKFHACNAGTVTITFTQTEDTGTPAVHAGMKVGGVHQDNVSFTITVTKHDPAFTWNLPNAEWASQYKFGDFFVSTNTATQWTAVSNTAIAEYRTTTDSIYTNYRSGIATFTVTQRENYYWNEYSQTLTTNVQHGEEDACYLYNSNPDNDPNQEIKVWNFMQATWQDTAVAGKVIFDARRSSTDVFHWVSLSVNEYINGNSHEVMSFNNHDDSYEHYEHDLNDYATGLLFKDGFGQVVGEFGNYTNRVKNVKVTRVPWIKASATDVTLPTIGKQGHSEATVTVYWSGVEPLRIEKKTNNPHFDVSPDAYFVQTPCTSGFSVLTLAYHSDEPGNETETIVIYDHAHSLEITLHGTTENKEMQEIVWNQSFNPILALGGTIDADSLLTAYATNRQGARTNQPITYTVGNTSIATIENGNHLHITNIGRTTITATVAGNGNYSGATKTLILNVLDGTGCGSLAFSNESEVTLFTITSDDALAVTKPSEDLYFEARRDWIAFLNPAAQHVKMRYKVAGDNNWKTQDENGVEIETGALNSDWGSYGPFRLPENTVGIQFYTEFGAYFSQHVRNVYITQRSYLRKDKDALMANIMVNTLTEVGEFTVEYSDKPTLIVENKCSNVKLFVDNPAPNECGTAGKYTYSVSCFSDTIGIIKDTVTVTSGLDDKLSVPVTIYVGIDGEFFFDNGIDHDITHTDWDVTQYWRKDNVYDHGRIPTMASLTTIEGPTVIDYDAYAYKMTITGSGKVTIAPNGSLKVGAGGIHGATMSNLILEADNTGQTGILRLYPGIADEKIPDALVQIYTTAYWDRENGKKAVWQYIGTPVRNPDTNEHIFYQCWLYQYNQSLDKWKNAGNWGHMVPFQAYAFTRDKKSSGPLTGFGGQLNTLSIQNVDLTYIDKDHCENHLANSWTAPIYLKQFKPSDFQNVDPIIYCYTIEGKGLAKEIAVYTSDYTGNDILPAMQGFFVKARSNENPQLLLDYERLVWKNETSKNAPLRAPSRMNEEESDLSARICIQMTSADMVTDRIYLLEKDDEGFSPDYEVGYDAPKYFVDGLPCIYTYETSGPHLAVSATDDVVGTYLAINTGASQDYTLTFSKVIGEGLGLRDLVTNTIVPITEGMQYAFTAPANSSPMLRFVVVEHEETPQWNNNNGGTSLEDVGGEFKIWQSGEILSVIGAGSHASLRIYDAAGKLILSEFFNEATAISLTALPTGVYMVQVNDKTEKVLR